MPAALENLAVAQHRDQRHYLQGKAAKEVTFAVGDFVYVKHHKIHSALQPAAKPEILRIKQLKSSGAVVLQGRCGRTIDSRVEHLAPCHLQLDPTIDPLLADEVDDIVCEVCGTDEYEDQLLLCELCNNGYHTFCLQPPLSAVPDGHWICPDCVHAGKTVADAERTARQREQQLQHDARPNIYPDAAMKRRDEAAAQLHGRLITRVFKDPATKRPRTYWGRVHFRGRDFRPHYFLIVYDHGDQHTMFMQVVKKHLKLKKAQGTELPAGLVVPEPAAMALLQQQLMSLLAAVAPPATVEGAAVPAAAMELLVDFMQDSLTVPLHDPVTQHQTVAAAMSQQGYKVSFSDPPDSNAAIITAPAASSLAACLVAHQKYKVRWIACYLPAKLQPKQRYLIKLLAAQRSNTLLQRQQHWWLVIG